MAALAGSRTFSVMAEFGSPAVPELPSAQPAVREPDRRRVWVVVAASVVLLGAGLVYVAMRDTGDGPATAPTDSGSVLTTGPATTTEPTPVVTEPAASSVPTSDAPTTTEYQTFDRACVDRTVTDAMPSIDESAAATLTGLPATPTLTISLPLFTDFEYEASPTVRVLRVPGGVLLAINQAGEPAGAGGMILALVGVDGGVRWVRCLPPTFVRGATWDAVQQAVVVDPAFTGTWYPLSLVDGTIGEQAVAEPPPWPEFVPEYPAVSVVVVPTDAPWPNTSSVIYVVGVDAAGTELWRDTTLHPSGGEGFHTATIDGLGVAQGCEERVGDDFACVGPHLRAYDPATGAVRWDVPGVTDVQLIVDGLAMVTVESGDHRLLSLSDGSFLAGQQWPAGIFGAECCGGAEYHYNDSQGGVVVNVDRDVVTVWYPAGMNLGSHEVSLP